MAFNNRNDIRAELNFLDDEDIELLEEELMSLSDTDASSSLSFLSSSDHYDDDDDDGDDDDWDFESERMRFEDRNQDSDEDSLDNLVAQKTSHVQTNCVAFYSKINEFFVDDKYTDVNIKCQNRVFKCHRLVLAAASEYFDKMFYGGFKESHLEEVQLHEVDCDIVEEVLRYAYKGEVLINDDNVYNLLNVSEMLRLSFIENQCVRYLQEQNIPIDYALEIFSFAHVTRKNALLSTVSRFILDQLNYFSRQSEFLRIPFEEFSTLLTYCQPSSARKEKTLLSAIFRWVSYWTQTRSDRRSSFAKLTRDIKFRHISPENIAQYLNERVDDGDVDTQDVLTSEYEDKKSTLHVFLNVDVDIPYPKNDDILIADFVQKRVQIRSKSHLFTMRKSNDDICWGKSCEVKPPVRTMRTVAHDNQLYCFRWLAGQFSFNVRSSVDMSTETRSLETPEIGSPFSCLMCCDRNNIYGYSNEGNELLLYNIELGKWSTMAYTRNVVQPIMACDDNRLYLIGGQSKHYQRLRNVRTIEAYDPRAGRWEDLQKSRLGHAGLDECCVHKKKIYVSAISSSRGDVLDVYDPVAGKWDIVELKIKLRAKSDCRNPHRLLSYDNRLWVFGWDQKKTFHTQTYNSFVEEWSPSQTLNSAAQQQIYPTSDLKERCYMEIVDAVVFNTS